MYTSDPQNSVGCHNFQPGSWILTVDCSPQALQGPCSAERESSFAHRLLPGHNRISHLRWKSTIKVSQEQVMSLAAWNVHWPPPPLWPRPTWSFCVVDLLSHPGSSFYDRKCVWMLKIGVNSTWSCDCRATVIANFGVGEKFWLVNVTGFPESCMELLLCLKGN